MLVIAYRQIKCPAKCFTCLQNNVAQNETLPFGEAVTQQHHKKENHKYFGSVMYTKLRLCSLGQGEVIPKQSVVISKASSSSTKPWVFHTCNTEVTTLPQNVLLLAHYAWFLRPWSLSSSRNGL